MEIKLELSDEQATFVGELAGRDGVSAEALLTKVVAAFLEEERRKATPVEAEPEGVGLGIAEMDARFQKMFGGR